MKNSIFFAVIFIFTIIILSFIPEQPVYAGAEWISQPSGTNYQLWDVHFSNDSTGWSVGDNGTIVYTTNGGSIWSPQTSGTTQYLLGIHVPIPFSDRCKFGTLLKVRQVLPGPYLQITERKDFAESLLIAHRF